MSRLACWRCVSRSSLITNYFSDHADGSNDPVCSGKIKNLEAKVVMLGSQGVGKTRDDDIWGTKNADVATTR